MKILNKTTSSGTLQDLSLRGIAGDCVWPNLHRKGTRRIQISETLSKVRHSTEPTIGECNLNFSAFLWFFMIFFPLSAQTEDLVNTAAQMALTHPTATSLCHRLLALCLLLPCQSPLSHNQALMTLLVLRFLSLHSFLFHHTPKFCR